MNCPSWSSVVQVTNRRCAALIYELAIALSARETFSRKYRPILPSGYRPVLALTRLDSTTFENCQVALAQYPLSNEVLTRDPIDEGLDGLSTQSATVRDMLKLAIELDPDSPSLRIARGAQHLDQAEHDLALEAFSKALSLSNEGQMRSRALTNVAAAYERLEDISRAIETSSLAMNQTSTSPLAVYNHRMLLARYSPGHKEAP